MVEEIKVDEVMKKVRKPRGKTTFVVLKRINEVVGDSNVVQEVASGNSIKTCRAKIEELGVVGDVQIVSIRERLNVTQVQSVLIKKV